MKFGTLQTSVPGGEVARDQGHFGTAFMVALALHIGALAAMMLWSAHDVQSPPGEHEITIDLAPAMEIAEALTPAEAASPAEILAEAADAQPPVDAPAILEIAEAKALEARDVSPPQEAVEAVPADAAPVDAPAAEAPEVIASLPLPEETVVAKAIEEKPAPKPVRIPPPKLAERKPPPRRKVSEQRPPPSTPRQGQVSSSRENTGGAAASADPNIFNRYAAQLAAALRGRLRYPEIARAQGISGVATVRFTMQRSGQIISASLVGGTGHSILDQAALATAAPGTSLPPAPDAVPQQQITIVVPLRFNLR